MKTDVVRKMDSLGRLFIPYDLRDALGWYEDTSILVVLQGEQVVLQGYHDRCFACGSEENLRPIHKKYICQKCIDEING